MSQTPQQPTQPNSRPNEQGVIHVQAFVRITDPATKQVILEQRA